MTHVLTERSFPEFPAVVPGFDILWMLERSHPTDDPAFDGEVLLEFDSAAFRSIRVPVNFGSASEVAVVIPVSDVAVPRPGVLGVRLLVFGTETGTWRVVMRAAS